MTSLLTYLWFARCAVIVICDHLWWHTMISVALYIIVLLHEADRGVKSSDLDSHQPSVNVVTGTTQMRTPPSHTAFSSYEVGFFRP